MRMWRKFSRITMSTLDLTQDFFLLFNLPRSFALDQLQLAHTYLALQSRYHPDRAAHLDEATKTRYIEAATYINEAYHTLKYPLNRARYLLQLEGVDTQEETNTAMPGDFLMAQMSLREAIFDASSMQNLAALEKLNQDIRQETFALENALTVALDQQQDNAQAALLVRQYRFYEKLDEEISDAIEAILL